LIRLNEPRIAIVFPFIVIASLARLAAQTPEVADSTPTFHAEVNLLSLSVRVTDHRDNEIHGLSAAQFSLLENGVSQKISFFDAEDEPVSLGILLDVSGSMRSTGKLDRAKDALSHLISTARPDDELFYLRFQRQVDRVVDFTSDRQRVLSAISETRATQDGTSLYDAVAEALCYMRKARHHKQALLVVTDGADQNSHRSLEDLIPIVQAANAQVFIITIFSPQEYDVYRNSREEKVALVTNQDIDNPIIAFKRLASVSGAEAYFLTSPEKLQEAVDLVAHQLRTQYTLAYYPRSSGRGFRRIEVKVARSGARVRTRRGFATEPSAGPSESSAGCEHPELKPYPYESKVAIDHGLTVYHDDFQNQASGWPSKKRFRYRTGAYEINSARQEQTDYSNYNSSPYAFNGVVVAAGDGGPRAEGVLVANGPPFGDFKASLSVEVEPAGGSTDTTTAAGLVFRLNDLGYYAVVVSLVSPGSREVAFKLVKKYHLEDRARDLLPWRTVPLPHEMPGSQKTITVRCQGTVISILVGGVPVAKFEDNTFEDGLVGMVLYGSGRAIFRDLLAEELGPER
jgi:Ca-activated chloride channel family protein